MSSSICILANFVWLCYLYYVYFVSLKDTQLHRDPSVLFAGYRLPHPLQYKLVIKIQTTSQPSPMQAYNLAVNDLDKELDHLKQVFQGRTKRQAILTRRELRSLLGYNVGPELRRSNCRDSIARI
ncbi:hypothetical protein R1flu_003390 [Riccia fluitans]|uniref:DNA-directed RNA polymerase RBP11-like dimerisation domain-containing protein n=1 Tax=Riccia fluitans TaxID=41844 RepID=A0ABD1Y906_9MARC